MAVGRPSIDPSWDASGGQPSSSLSQAPAVPPTNDGSIEEARKILGSQPEHEELVSSTTATTDVPQTLETPIVTESGQTVDTSGINVPLGEPATAQSPAATTPLAPHIPRQEATEPIQPPATHLPGFAVALIGLVVLVAITGGVFLASELGWLSLGIERLWSLPNNPASALSDASQSLAASEAYRIDGNITLKLDSATTELQFREQVVGESSQVALFWQVPDSSSIAVAGPRFDGGGSTQVLAITQGDELFTGIGAAGEVSTWRKSSLAQLENLKLQPLDWPTLLTAIAPTPSKLVGGKTINGIKTKGYEFEVPAGTIAGLLSPSLGLLPGTLTTTIWLGTGDGRPYLIEFTGTVGPATIQGKLVAADYDIPTALDIPTGEGVTEGSLADWLEEEGLIAIDSAKSRDAQRRSDLEDIARALEELAAASSPFSYPKTSGSTKFEDSPELLVALTPYIDAIPTDPQAPDKYYGYSSDGSSYRLTAVAETEGDETTGDLKLIVRTSQ